jgi:hypothetical protein
LTGWDFNGAGATPVTRVPAPQPIHWQSLPRTVALGGNATDTQVCVWNRLGVDSTDYATASRDALGRVMDLRDLTQPYRWPRAIRITLRVWDPAGRLPEPITHTIVHAF